MIIKYSRDNGLNGRNMIFTCVRNPIDVEYFSLSPAPPARSTRHNPTISNKQTLADHAGLMASEISKNPEDWERRRDALVSMQKAVEDVGQSGTVGSLVFNVELWRELKEPLKNTLVRHEGQRREGREKCVFPRLSSDGTVVIILMLDSLIWLCQSSGGKNYQAYWKMINCCGTIRGIAKK